ncbi:hypothetical protein BC830DRAFT_821500 [Chytriomyces sp. MP71]|nr:hypothetical protein BC830DRAFT_821500 [Chytriomyces sp. MP71]
MHRIQVNKQHAFYLCVRLRWFVTVEGLTNLFVKTNRRHSSMFGKKKNVQAKRGLNALVLASAAAGSIAIPSMINALSTLRLALPVQQPPPSQDFNTAKTRAKSLGAVAFNATTPTSPPNTSTSPQKCPSTDSLRHPKSAPLPRPLASTAAGVAPAAEDEDWDAEIAHTSSSTCPTSTLVLTPSSEPLSLPPFPRKPAVARARVQPRRVVSAPATPSLFFLEDETGVPAGRGVVDAMWEPLCEDAFMVASVRQKVLARRERELERSVSAEAGLESWDDDFCCFEGQEEELVGGRGKNNGLGALKVPEYLGNVQEALRVDADNIRKFALHIEGWACLFEFMIALGNSPPKILTQTLNCSLWTPKISRWVSNLTRQNWCNP